LWFAKTPAVREINNIAAAISHHFVINPDHGALRQALLRHAGPPLFQAAGTHNRYFPGEKELTGTLSRVFGEMQTYPERIRPYLQSFL
jgi:hypothetical protein